MVDPLVPQRAELPSVSLPDGHALGAQRQDRHVTVIYNLKYFNAGTPWCGIATGIVSSDQQSDCNRLLGATKYSFFPYWCRALLQLEPSFGNGLDTRRSNRYAAIATRGQSGEADMKNPWLKKNPVMSMWLSGANAVANATRVQAQAEIKRQAKAASTKNMKTWLDLWTVQPPAAARKKKRAR